MALSQLFWDVLMPWNLKSTYFSLKMIHFLSLNIWYVIYVVFWIKYWNLKLPHHCILFLFTICTVSQLFWNRVCTCFICRITQNVQMYTWCAYLCMCVSSPLNFWLTQMIYLVRLNEDQQLMSTYLFHQQHNTDNSYIGLQVMWIGKACNQTISCRGAYRGQYIILFHKIYHILWLKHTKWS